MGRKSGGKRTTPRGSPRSQGGHHPRESSKSDPHGWWFPVAKSFGKGPGGPATWGRVQPQLKKKSAGETLFEKEFTIDLQAMGVRREMTLRWKKNACESPHLIRRYPPTRWP